MNQSELDYVFNTRSTTSGIRYAKAKVNNKNGVILLPDNWSSSTYSLSNTNSSSANFSSNTISASQWMTLENAGAIFLPAAGYGTANGLGYYSSGSCMYWSSSYYDSDKAYALSCTDSDFNATTWSNRNFRRSLRLVADCIRVNATPSPAEFGSVNGAGNYYPGQICHLTAVPNTGYTFVNWTTIGGAVVSTDANFYFLVTSERNLVANFQILSYSIAVSANPAESGTVAGAGNYEHGQSCTLTATPNIGYTFINWTENGTEVSTEATYTFTATEAGAYVANFSLNNYEITVTSNPAVGGEVTGTGTYDHGTEVTLTATANEGYTFINWTEDGEEVSTEAEYTFVVTGDRTLEAKFEKVSVEMTFALDDGWNWFSTNIEITLNDLKAALVAALPGATSITIKSKIAYTTYNGSMWRGVLKTLDVSQMYKIYVDADCEITLTGTRINPAEHPLTIHNGANWIAFPLSESMSIRNAFAGFAVGGDMVRSKTTASTYNGSIWRGVLNTLEPGKGYVYKSVAPDDRVFIFPAE